MASIKDYRIFKNFSLHIKAIVVGPIYLFPKFPYTLFYLSSLVSLFITLLLGPFSQNLYRDQVLLGLDPILLNRWASFFQLPFFDPILFQVVFLFIATYMIYKIVKKKEQETRNYFALFSPWIIYFLCLVIVEFVFKPAFGYSRPVGYSDLNESVIVQFFRGFFGTSQSAPSGNIVRQICCVMLLIVLSRHSKSPIKSKIARFFLYFFSILSIIIIAFQRFIINAHSIFDIVFAIGCGIIIFWLVYVISYDIHNINNAVEKVMSIYLLYIALFYFYSKKPFYWLSISLLLLFVFYIIEIISKYIRASRINGVEND